MAGYSYQSSYSSGGAGGAADAIFNQVDLNRDGVVDHGEFSSFLGQHAGVGAGYGGSSSWESAAYGAGAGLGAGFSVGTGLGTGVSSFESSSLGATLGGAYDASYAVGGGLAGGLVGGATSYESVLSGAGLAGGAVYDSSAAAGQVHYATDARGLFQDPNPQIIRRPAPGGVQTYTQNIRVRFLQPPPVPPPGPLIIREVRPPQPPVPPPLRIRQQAPPLPTPPPLVLRERPPVPPASVASQTVIRRLAAIPVPPRSVIIERLPAAPARPRDIVIERWIPYGPQQRRRTVVQRAAAARGYQAPRNTIIQYEQAPARIVRQFHRLGVVATNPSVYVQTYGAHLLDGASLVAQARAAGVVEDISPPGFVGYTGAAYGQESFGVSTGLAAGAGLVAGGAQVIDAGLALGGGGGGGGVVGLDAGLVAGGLGGGVVAGGLDGGYGASSFESSSFSTGGTLGVGDVNLLLAQNAGGIGGASSYESYGSSYSY